MVYTIAGCGTDSIPIEMLVLIICYYYLLLIYFYVLRWSLCEVEFLFLFCVSSPNQIPVDSVEMAIKY